ncbi:tetratricopeptide repeat protein [Mangrovicella endophytica]|uniref:tetratricopeptide repeat protein n=1 Tax=Mangrovicella endophytica TaxID=2066697 RepID=UPI0018E47912|nr:tetratricopeptide repeat protein [Mangrovicella endophytica]
MRALSCLGLAILLMSAAVVLAAEGEPQRPSDEPPAAAPAVPAPGSPAAPAAPDIKAAPLPRFDSSGPKTAEKPRGERLDALFAELKREPSADKAGGIASSIESIWRDSGSDTVDLLMLWSAAAIAKKDNAAALDLLDQVVLLAPDYAEGWNRRATLNFTMNRYPQSIADVEQTLRREPRHYGALMGLGMILEELDQKDKALDAYSRALAVYPALKAAQDAVGRLADELGGQPI